MTVVGFAAYLSAQVIRRTDHPAEGGMIDGRALNGQGPFAPQGLNQVQPDAYICILLTGAKTNHIAFAEQGRQIAAEGQLPYRAGSQQQGG